MNNIREQIKNKKRIVIKIGSSSLQHAETGDLDYIRLEKLVRELCDISNQGKEVVLVTSGAIAVGKKAVNLKTIEGKTQAEAMAVKQACSAIGQARLMMAYPKLFAEYIHVAEQILMTKYTMINRATRINAKNTFDTLLEMGAIPIVNENDTISTDEIEFGDNDTLSALVAALTGADMLILLSDIDGLFTDDPNQNPNAEFIDLVEKLDSHLDAMAKDTSKSSVGTGGMATKLKAAHIATSAGADMVIANGNDFHVIHKIMQGRNHGTLFLADKKEEFYLDDIIDKLG